VALPYDPWAGTTPGTPDLDPPSAAQRPFRDAMSRLAGGVCVLTTRDPVGRDCGITATAVASVSLAPPLILVCVRRGSFISDALDVCDGWALTMLADDQADLARYAARHRHPGDGDDFGRWAPRREEATGALVFPGGVAAVECVPFAQMDAGDHAVIVGRVVAVAPEMAGARALVYVDRSYRAPGDPVD
jgi:flavin reductase (DIM6/NTAB) family NADH-FMN oxidoreductase RutF